MTKMIAMKLYQVSSFTGDLCPAEGGLQQKHIAGSTNPGFGDSKKARLTPLSMDMVQPARCWKSSRVLQFHDFEKSDGQPSRSFMSFAAHRQRCKNIELRLRASAWHGKSWAFARRAWGRTSQMGHLTPDSSLDATDQFLKTPFKRCLLFPLFCIYGLRSISTAFTASSPMPFSHDFGERHSYSSRKPFWPQKSWSARVRPIRILDSGSLVHHEKHGPDSAFRVLTIYSLF